MDNSPWIEKLENASCCEQEKKEFLRLFEFLDPSGTLLEHLKKQTQEQQQTHVYNESAIGSYVSILPSEDDVKELDEKRFFNKISEKVKKYEQYSGPLVVSIFTDAMHQKGILENLGKVNSYLKNKSSLSAILWVDRCHPFVDGWIINIVHNHNSNSRINCILEGGEYINGDTSSSHYRIYPKKKLASCKQYEFYEFLRKTPPLPALLENNPCIQRCHYWLTPIHVKIEFLLAPTSDKATSSGYMDRLLRIPMENA
jgi:hypothetical protein